MIHAAIVLSIVLVLASNAPAQQTPASPPPEKLMAPRGWTPPPPGDPPFRWYVEAVRYKVRERWNGRGREGPQPVVSFEIERDGRVSNLAIKHSSGEPEYDRLALQTIRETAPFLRLPDDVEGRVLRVELGFSALK